MLLLHLGLLIAFVIAMNARVRVTNHIQEIEVSFPAFIAKTPPPTAPLPPEMIAPLVPLQLARPPELSIPEITPAPPSGSISGVGRTLFGCDPLKMDTLSPEERAACARLPPGKPREQNVRLGPPPDPNSPWAEVIAERFRKAQPINHPCPLGSYNDIHGLPCLFGFSDNPPQPQQ